MNTSPKVKNLINVNNKLLEFPKKKKRYETETIIMT